MWKCICTARLKIDCRLVAKLAVSLVLSFSHTGTAATEDVEPAEELVEIHYAPDVLSPYKERRGFWAPVVGLGFSAIRPTGFVSDFTDENDSDFSYDDIFGKKTMSTFSFYGGFQINFGGISIGPTIGIMTGKATGEGGGGLTQLNISCRKAGIIVNLDGIMQEPYVVPTAHFELNLADYVEEFATEDAVNISSKSTTPFLSYTVGALIQLNWIDPDGTFVSLKENGLNNTFVHLYLGQLMATSGSSTSFSTPIAFGAGVKLEF